MMTAIILVNWNGADDTIACLESLSRMTEPHFVVIADNSSSDDSVSRIQAWIDEFGQDNPVVRGYQLLSLDENYGFAVGNNKALAAAMQRNPDYCILLNNDTEVEPDFLSKLVDFAEDDKGAKVLSPCICYYSQKTKVWFSGGNSFWFPKESPCGKRFGSSWKDSIPHIIHLWMCLVFSHIIIK